MKRVAHIDFWRVFDALPSPHVLMDRDFDILAANQAYLDATMRRRSDLIGFNMFTAFPAQDDNGGLLRASLERARDERTVTLLPVLPYAIPRTAEAGGGFELRYWSCTHAPILDAAGEVVFVLQNTQDVTELQRLKEIARGPRDDDQRTMLGDEVLRRAEAVQELNRDLFAERSRLHQLFMQAPGLMAVLRGPDHVIDLANNAYLQVLQRDHAIIGRPLRDAVPEMVAQGYLDLLDRVYASGEPFVASDIRAVIAPDPGGPGTERFFNLVFQPILDGRGRVQGIFIQANDVTSHVRAEQRQSLLMDELNHRVKNTLATVQAIAIQTLRSSPPEAFAEAFQARLTALARTHDVLTQTRWQGAGLRDLLEQELRPYRGARVALRGPAVNLAPRQALALGLVFHELATNAVKYGALSVEAGQLHVAWQVAHGDGGAALTCEWREDGGPPAAAPAGAGFGSKLIERSLRNELDGTLAVEYRPEGLRLCFTIPLAEPDAAANPPQPAGNALAARGVEGQDRNDKD